jgi:2-oxoglutarate ferredoxin oxidoreductase subunit beta
LLYVNGDAEDLHEHLRTVDTPLNRLSDSQLCPGAAALAAINAELG